MIVEDPISPIDLPSSRSWGGMQSRLGGREGIRSYPNLYWLADGLLAFIASA